jgi:hypothetical protein
MHDCPGQNKEGAVKMNLIIGCSGVWSKPNYLNFFEGELLCVKD